MRARSIGAVFVSLSICLGAGPGNAEQREASARDSLILSAKALAACDSYSVEAAYRAGLSPVADETREIHTETTKRSYAGKVVAGGRRTGGIMHVPSMGVYRTPRGAGVVQRSGRWVRLTNALAADRDMYRALQMNRLFEFPLDLLLHTLKFSRASRWLTEKEYDAFYLTDGKDRPDTAPRVVRVDVPGKAAVSALTEQALRFKQCCSGAVKLSGAIASKTSVFYDVHLDPRSGLPTRIDAVYVTEQFDGRRGATLWDGRKKVSGAATDLVVLRVSYVITGFSDSELTVPEAVRKTLSKGL